MMKWILFLTLLLAATPSTSQAMSFLDKEHSDKLAKEAKKQQKIAKKYASTSRVKESTDANAGLSAYQLFLSPIQPGGSYLMTINPMNLYRSVRGLRMSPSQKQIEQMKLLEKYVEVQVDSDPDVVAFRNNPAPNKNWKAELKAMKEAKRVSYRDTLVHSTISLR